MRIAIVHYHLKRGGVTRVIETTLRGFETMDNPPDCAILAGEVPDDFRYKSRARKVEGLHYSNAQAQTPDSRTLLEHMRSAAREALGGEPDVWHIHNHSLGKNSAMPGVVAALAACGDPMLLQMHDFAEDGRPENYRTNRERPTSAHKYYPDGGNIHYGVLNARDYEIFQQTGLNKEQLHLLPNPVEINHGEADQHSGTILDTLGAERLFLYPVRAVRRKNFGEMLLWAALAPEGDAFATTLGPTNQNYLHAYQNWQAFARKHRLPVEFGIGERYDWPFEAIMQSAHAILSTSIAEGFGLAFLEPWRFGKPIVGRDLPDITADFKAHGIKLNSLYESLPIPDTWIDVNKLKSAIARALGEAYAAYGRPLPPDAVERALAGIRPAPEYIDFAGLNEPLQESIVERVLSDPSAAGELPAMPRLPAASTIAENAGRIARTYSLSSYAKNLIRIYTQIRSSDATAAIRYIDPETVLDGFLQPERFRLLRT
jgi:glycosyltransferase involved in cell wall biosynthesis